MAKKDKDVTAPPVKDSAPKAAKIVKLYPLGPQPDGAVVIRVPTDFDLMIMRKAIEKQGKNAGTAEGTLSALAEGDDPFLSSVQVSLTKLLKLVSTARAPENQIADTPIGKEMAMATKAALAGETPEPIDGRPGDVWAPHVPTPRPRILDGILWPDGSSTAVHEIFGWDADAAGFSVLAADGMKYAIAHAGAAVPPWNGATRWHICGANYPPIATQSEADALTAGTSLDPKGADPITDGAPAKAKKAPRAANPAQRSRNATANGLKGGGKKGGGK